MKRRLLILAMTVILMVCMAVPVSADSAASRVDLFCTVDPDGNCLVNMTVTLRLDGDNGDMTFPLPRNATGITLNKASVRTTKTDSAIEVDISRLVSGLSGEFSMQFDYALPKIVTVMKRDEKEQKKLEEKLKKQAEEQKLQEEAAKKASENAAEAGETLPQQPTAPTQPTRKSFFGKELELTLPLLSGFAYPVENLAFTINLPNPITEAPSFSSIYRQNSIESILNTTISGNMIIGESTAQLNDHEGLTMTMIVPPDMFPNVSTYVRNGNPEVVPMGIFAGIALLYWLIFLSTLPLWHRKASVSPSDITAGELGCRLTLAGGDLTMMVISWAQLGYLLIQLDKNGRILLHQRMEMGNERSQFENKIFKMLFGKRTTVDATNYQYAKLCRRVESMVPGERTMCKSSSGNIKLFRGICCVVQIFCGICVAMNMTASRPLQIILSIVLAAFGAISAWQIQEIAYRTHLRGKLRVFIGLGLCLIWILLGWIAGQVIIPLCSVLGQFAFSYLAAYGGRRSDLNRHDACQILGLRRFLKRIPKEEIARMTEENPDYFFEMAPYALALGVIKPYAKNFRGRKLIGCPYLITKSTVTRSSDEWAVLLKQMANRMDELKDRMELERWIPYRFR